MSTARRGRIPLGRGRAGDMYPMNWWSAHEAREARGRSYAPVIVLTFGDPVHHLRGLGLWVPVALPLSFGFRWLCRSRFGPEPPIAVINVKPKKKSTKRRLPRPPKRTNGKKKPVVKRSHKKKPTKLRLPDRTSMTPTPDVEVFLQNQTFSIRALEARISALNSRVSRLENCGSEDGAG